MTTAANDDGSGDYMAAKYFSDRSSAINLRTVDVSKAFDKVNYVLFFMKLLLRLF